MGWGRAGAVVVTHKLYHALGTHWDPPHRSYPPKTEFELNNGKFCGIPCLNNIDPVVLCFHTSQGPNSWNVSGVQQHSVLYWYCKSNLLCLWPQVSDAWLRRVGTHHGKLRLSQEVQ